MNDGPGQGASDSNREQCTTDGNCLLLGRGQWWFQIRFIHNLDTLSLPRLVDGNGRVSLTQVSVGHPIKYKLSLVHLFRSQLLNNYIVCRGSGLRYL